jgi:hypothetical protein
MRMRKFAGMMDGAGLPFGEDFYAGLEILAAGRRSCEIVFRSDNGAKTVIRDRIVGVNAVEGWVRTGNGLQIGLDRLIEVDGIKPSNVG